MVATSSTTAVRRGLELLARRPRTESELRSALAAEHPAEAVEQAVARLRTLRYLDDEAWAAAHLSTARAQQRGALLLRRELLARGVSAAIADAALAGREDRTAALAAARHRLRALQRLERGPRERRLRGYLHRRGFAAETVNSVLLELLDAQE